MSKVDQKKPAFPVSPNQEYDHPDWYGLTKREYFAAMAMQGVVAGQPNAQINPVNIAYWAVRSADALIAELEKPVEPEAATPDDGWIEWKGGECPVGPQELVMIRFADGDSPPAPTAAGAWPDGWSHEGDGKGYIIRYCVVKEAVNG